MQNNKNTMLVKITSIMNNKYIFQNKNGNSG